MNAKLAESFDPQMGMNAALTASSSVQDRVSGGEECPMPSKDNPLRPTSLPQYTHDSMWDKVQRYLHDPSSYTSAPGVSDKSCTGAE